jgi:hypothetical protein
LRPVNSPREVYHSAANQAASTPWLRRTLERLEKIYAAAVRK